MYLDYCNCNKCGTQYMGDPINGSGLCQECWQKKEDADQREKNQQKLNRLNQLKTKTIEERIAHIESWIYDHQNNHPECNCSEIPLLDG